ncbi:MAG TPA: RNA polymerase sigma-70 factor [Lentimicrobium sp.]|nr:RNA polymerase sigma-70 factor [Lentimicrobium sp.]
MTEADKLVVIAFQQGDFKVFETVFKENYSSMVRAARRILIDIEPAEEVIQDLFVKLWEKRDSLVINTSLPAYLHKAVTNHAINYYKFQKKTVRFQDYIGFEVDDYQSVAADEPMLHNDLDKKVNALMKALPERRRMIFEMSRFEGMKNWQIAQQMGVSLKTVEYHMAAALDFLRTKLSDYLPVILLAFFLLKNL